MNDRIFSLFKIHKSSAFNASFYVDAACHVTPVGLDSFNET